MTERLPVADDIVPVVKILIATLGVEAFKHEGRVQLYSGPAGFIRMALDHLEPNHAYASRQAARARAVMIEHTKIGQLLARYHDSGNIYDYFEYKYAPIHGAQSKIARENADCVMRFASREFIRASFGHVATAVCGADPERIFFSVELPALVENSRIEKVNDIDMERVRAIYHTKGNYEAFRKICQAEILLAYRGAKLENTKTAWDDYWARRQYFTLDRQNTLKQARAVKKATDYLTTTVTFISQGVPTHPALVPVEKNVRFEP